MSLSEQNRALVLKPCPFCGSGETFTRSWQGENGGSFAFARCSQCGASTQDSWPDEARAALEWNRRAEGVAALQQAGEPVARKCRLVAGILRRDEACNALNDRAAAALEDAASAIDQLSSPLPQQTALVEDGVEIAAFLIEQDDEPLAADLGVRMNYWRDKCITAGQRLDPKRWGPK